MASQSLKVIAMLFAGLVPCVAANSFLQVRPHTEKVVSIDAVRQSFLAAMSLDASILQKVEDELRPMYAALPKNQRGTLEPGVVRYALHRYFVQKHGWYMKGLEPSGDASNSSSSPAAILKDRVPEFIQGLLEDQTSKEGWTLHELAICSSALNELVQREVIQDLEFVYDLLGFSREGNLEEEEVHRVLDAYLVQYILEETWSDLTFNGMLREVRETYTGWNDLSLWARDLRLTLDSSSPRRNPFVTGTSFARMMEIVQEIMHRYTSVQNLECSTLSEALFDLEHQGTGRVPLADFYRVGLGDKFKFWEPKEYLRHVGALDETDPKRPTLIIPNYVYGMNNCLASSSFFSVCCTNKCERLVGHLEGVLQAPSAMPSQMAELVAGLPSDTVDAPRTLSKSLLARLEEIAAMHNGQVPLHSRLFSQWMHHAYPRECPFPHAERAENKWTPEQWNAETGKDFALSEGEMRSVIDRHAHFWKVKQSEGGEELPWAAVEELVGVDHRRRPSRATLGGLLRKGAAMLLVSTVAASILRAWKATLGASRPAKADSQMV